MKHLLANAKYEIETLRRENEVLRAKVDTMELFGAALRTRVSSEGRLAGPDVLWELCRKIQDIESNAANTAGASGGGTGELRPANLGSVSGTVSMASQNCNQANSQKQSR